MLGIFVLGLKAQSNQVDVVSLMHRLWHCDIPYEFHLEFIDLIEKSKDELSEVQIYALKRIYPSHTSFDRKYIGACRTNLDQKKLQMPDELIQDRLYIYRKIIGTPELTMNQANLIISIYSIGLKFNIKFSTLYEDNYDAYEIGADILGIICNTDNRRCAQRFQRHTLLSKILAHPELSVAQVNLLRKVLNQNDMRYNGYEDLKVMQYLLDFSPSKEEVEILIEPILNKSIGMRRLREVMYNIVRTRMFGSSLAPQLIESVISDYEEKGDSLDLPLFEVLNLISRAEQINMNHVELLYILLDEVNSNNGVLEVDVLRAAFKDSDFSSEKVKAIKTLFASEQQGKHEQILNLIGKE
jgi:disulfide oxidoreductase YuzD